MVSAKQILPYKQIITSNDIAYTAQYGPYKCWPQTTQPIAKYCPNRFSLQEETRAEAAQRGLRTGERERGLNQPEREIEEREKNRGLRNWGKREKKESSEIEEA